jgi:hypothetical protein
MVDAPLNNWKEENSNPSSTSISSIQITFAKDPKKSERTFFERESKVGKIFCTEVSTNFKIPPAKIITIEIFLDDSGRYRKYRELLGCGDSFIITGLKKEQISFPYNRGNPVLRISDYDAYRNNKNGEVTLLPVYSDSQKQEISFVVEDFFRLGTDDKRCVFQAKESFLWEGKKVDKITLIPKISGSEWSEENCRGKTIIVKQVSLVKKMNSAKEDTLEWLDIGVSWYNERKELSYMHGYGNITFEEVKKNSDQEFVESFQDRREKSSGGVGKSFWGIGITGAILLVIFSFFYYYYQKRKIKK